MGKTWSDRFVAVGVLLGGMSIYLFSKGPAVSREHQMFRLAVPVIGLVLVLIGLAMKPRGGPRDTP